MALHHDFQRLVLKRGNVPNLLTATSLVLGLCAIVSAGRGNLETAGWFVIWCAMLDVADGPVARLLKATSAFGAAFDSLADLVAFGLAPAALVLHLLWQDPGSLPPWWVAVPCALYALLAAIRLARFNVTTPERPGWFQGVPSPAAGALVGSGVILLVRYEHSAVVTIGMPYLPLALLAIGLLMVSTVPFPRPRLASSRVLNIALITVVLLVYLCGFLQVWPEYLFSVAILVLLSGLAAGLRRPSLP